MHLIVKGNFETALNQAKATKNSIGTYMEKTLHSTLKYYFEPDSQFHEMPYGKKIADISNEFGIIEIQTRSFDKLRSKLDLFLSEEKTTIVYPYSAIKWLVWVNPETGEVTKKRKSPKKLAFFDAFYELYKIKPYLKNPNLSIYLLGLEIEEYRLKSGWSCDGKKGSERLERFPIRIVESLHIKNIDDFCFLIPDSLPSPFTNEQYAKYAKTSINTANKATNCLCSIGILEIIGKENRKNLYKIK